MDRMNLERIVEEVINQWFDFSNRNDNIRVEKIIDRHANRFLLMQDGWFGWRRIYGTTFDIELRGDKIWILEDNTEEGVVNDLLEKGVSHEQIVLGWQHPNKRSLSEFATN